MLGNLRQESDPKASKTRLSRNQAAVPPRKPRAVMQVFGRVLAIAAVAVTVIAGTTTGASAATVDKTCQSRAEGISTCEWLATSLVYVPYLGRDDTQIKTWAQMKGGGANREIYEIKLEYRVCGMSDCGIFVEIESQIPVVGGTSTISAYIGPVLCAYAYYRPLFVWKIYEGKPAYWVTGTSYGAWEYNQMSPCDDGS
jgi:hypothetical protein